MEKVYIFGCGKYFHAKIADVLKSYDIIAVLDNNMHGKTLYVGEKQINIIEPSKMQKEYRVIIMIANHTLAEIQLLGYGITKEQFIYSYEFTPLFNEEVALLEEKNTQKADFITKSAGLQPLNRTFGFSRGTPIDRWYIENWLNQNKHFITGDVLEIAEDTYTKRFGIKEVRSHILHVSPEEENQIKGNLETGEGIVENSMDCVILTQTLPFIYNTQKVMMNIYKMLKKGGHALITCGGITQISRYDMDRWGHYWSFTDLTIKKLIEEYNFSDYKIDCFGNVKTACAMLYGISAEEMTTEDLSYFDNDYVVSICARITK